MKKHPQRSNSKSSCSYPTCLCCIFQNNFFSTQKCYPFTNRKNKRLGIKQIWVPIPFFRFIGSTNTDKRLYPLKNILISTWKPKHLSCYHLEWSWDLSEVMSALDQMCSLLLSFKKTSRSCRTCWAGLAGHRNTFHLSIQQW